ncbi:hypothetical protein BD324DRAFT_434316 [Kockovaella imperatae]|uniref:CAP-Gly domain-containing protein n=1 Tax=Kockovaella imperatae TaxID=4999 RepID=A0A1Y1UGN8_9TREE|nr:hypothetical protein BD324DRAFT_434316 [Kockovaella imperatae]ORX37230.1 hypothetical protein BD324DRAFT_434316 [Kockovaella imperatae]
MTSNAIHDYAIGHRYLHSKTRYPLTLRYIGPLPPPVGPAEVHFSTGSSGSTDTLWLGVEYDDPAHGKGHSGTYKGIQVFKCRSDGSGAFIKLSSGVLIRGQTLVQAFEERYGGIAIDSHEAESYETPERSIKLGTSGITVEAPGMQHVKRKFGQLEKLKEVGLEGEWTDTLGGTEQQRRTMKERLKGVRLLNLGSNLLCSWDQVGEIISVFTGLSTLILNHSRISSGEIDTVTSSDILGELYLGDAGISWHEACDIARLFPHLSALHLNDNPLISTLDRCLNARIKSLSLAGCPLTNWEEIHRALSGSLSLESLDLSRVPISSIPPSPHPTGFASLNTLLLSETSLCDWTDIDHLAVRLPQLTTLRISSAQSTEQEVWEDSPAQPPLSSQLSGNDLQDRPFLIAKIESLSVLNGSQITSDERRDAEMHYVKQVTALIVDHPEQAVSWGRYSALRAKHGMQDVHELVPKARINDLRSKMIALTIVHAKRDPFTISVLPSSSTVSLKRKIAKRMDRDANSLHLWTLAPPVEDDPLNTLVKGQEVHDGRSVEWWFSHDDRVLWTGGGVHRTVRS